MDDRISFSLSGPKRRPTKDKPNSTAVPAPREVMILPFLTTAWFCSRLVNSFDVDPWAVQLESGASTPASRSRRGAAHIAPTGLSDLAKAFIKSMISVRFRRSNTAGPPGRSNKSNVEGSVI